MSFNESDARKFYGVLGHTPTDWTWIRIKDPDTDAILYHGAVQGEAAFIEVVKKYWDKTVWAGLNPRKTREGSKNEDVSRRTAILVDIDIHHADKSPATAAEIVAALAQANTLADKLVAEGHPRPWIDVSGNGVHMILRLNISLEESPRARVLDFYATLGVKVDPDNADYARMCRVTGTLNKQAGRLSYLFNAGEWDNDATLEGFLRGNEAKKDGQQNLTVNVKDTGDGTDAEAKQRIREIKKFLGKDCRPCIRAMIQGTHEAARGDSGDLDHEAHLCIVKEAQYHGLGMREICALFMQQPDYNIDKTQKYVKAAVEDNAVKGTKPWFCDNLIKRGWCIALDPELCDAARFDPTQVKPKDKEDPKDKATELINLAHESAVEFFRDQYKTPYAVVRSIAQLSAVSTVTTDGILQKNAENSNVEKIGTDLKTTDGADGADGNEEKIGTDLKTTDGADGADGNEEPTQTIAISSKAFKWWLAKLYHEKTGGVVGKEYINSASLVLEAETQAQPVRYLYNRFAPNGELSFWWDMADARGRAIHIDKDGWEIRPAPRIFIHHDHMMPLPEPMRTRDLSPILDYLNLEDPGDKLLAVVGNISRLVPGVPRIGSVSTGLGGSGKSTWDLLSLYTLDPASTDLLTIPAKDEDLIQVLEHHAVAIFDNVGSITKSQSDIFCRAITGAGVEKRELYTTDESYIRQFMHVVGFNGVSMPVERGDLFSRVILLAFKKIEDDQRKTFSEMKALIKNEVPQLIGAMLTVLVDAIRIYPTIKSRLNVRMSDYAQWGVAITLALGLKPRDFEDAYRENIKGQDEEAVRASLVAEMIIKYMTKNGLNHLEGSAAELKEMLENGENPDNGYGRPSGDLLSRREGWPKGANKFGRDLSEVANNMASLGYYVVTPKRGRGDRRKYTVDKVASKKDGLEVKGQRSLEAVDPEELTETRLEVALAGKVKDV